MKKTTLLLVFLTVCAQAGLKAQTTGLDSTTFSRIYPFALRGEMNEVFAMLDATEDHQLTQKQQSRKQQYQDRFITRAENFEHNTSHPVVIDMHKRFQNYWRSVLIEKVDPEHADELFFNEMMLFLKREFGLEKSLEEVEDEYYGLFQKYFRSIGFYGIAMGKTGHLYDLYLWKEEKEVVHDIALPETNVKVPVVFMEGFVSTGWSYYTTFGHSATGGWVAPDRIYCVTESWDLDSENFRVSYVAHEAQHFADRKVYPKLKQADLEYRAKLTELALAEESMMAIIKTFINLAKNDKSNAHAYANHLVIQQLSQAIFKSDYVTDLEKWEKVPVKKINSFGEKALKAYSKTLHSLGAETVESGIL